MAVQPTHPDGGGALGIAQRTDAGGLRGAHLPPQAEDRVPRLFIALALQGGEEALPRAV